MGKVSELLVNNDESGSLPRPEAVVQDASGALVHVSTWAMDDGLYTVPTRRLRYLVLGRGRLASDGWVGRVGGLDGRMHGWVRLEVPCKADYDCGDMVGLYPPVPTPSGVCLRVSVWPLLTLAWSTLRACLLAVLDDPSSSRGRVQCGRVDACRCTCDRPDSPTPFPRRATHPA